ncbi:MAG: ferrochelatase [Proteobacteria bacterium]|nr:ferrochelatase [Pseudomonadota bacterium]MDA1021750.1 ferrochelatase [Pseudomonadota bacterium]
MSITAPRIAVVLFNLGGPDAPEAIEPFLFNLFNDPAIIGKPAPLRWLLAKVISRRRAPVAREIYRHIGGKSPLLEETEAQARALESVLAEDEGEYRAFIAMRYWHPMSDQSVQAVKDFDPDRIVLLPLYPHFSTTTTGSSLKDWRRAAKAAGLDIPTNAVCCYPKAQGYIAGLAAGVAGKITGAGKSRVLFSAHGLPKKIIAAGDPYQWQIEQTAKGVVQTLGVDGLDWAICYQSRVGPLEWIGPSLDDELARAGQDGVPVVVVPIAFVSEHSETLVELDIEYRKMAAERNVPGYTRVPAIGVEENFIAALAGIVRGALDKDTGVCSQAGVRICPANHGQCPL